MISIPHDLRSTDENFLALFACIVAEQPLSINKSLTLVLGTSLIGEGMRNAREAKRAARQRF